MIFGQFGICRGVDGVKSGLFLLILAISAIMFSAPQASAREPFNIQGIKIGDSFDDLEKVFPEVEVEAFENKAHCKVDDEVIENGSWYVATRDDDFQKFSFTLIFIDGVQTVVSQEYSYNATSVSPSMFMAKLHEKYRIDEITEENISTVKTSMADYKAISHFIVPEGHFFNIDENDVIRLRYGASVTDKNKPTELTHTVDIQSKKYNSLKESQAILGNVEKMIMEYDCGKEELEGIGL